MVWQARLLVVALLLQGCLGRRDWKDTGRWVDSDGDGYGDGVDCKPDDAAVNPGATETCNGFDDDCDGLVDDDDNYVMGTSPWSHDDDGDGFGDVAVEFQACEPPEEGMVDNASDCDDGDDQIFPGAEEVCDGVDNDCNLQVDDDATDATEWYVDDDGDGWGSDEWIYEACDQPSGFSDQSGDCDDENETIYPDAEELCDGEDNDCDGETDEDVTDTFYRDRDSDGFGDADVYVEQCPAPNGYVSDNADCDDDDASIHPSTTEYCDGTDYDRDGVTMEDNSADATTWYEDGDGDGYCDAHSTTQACEQPSGWADDDSDCDDGDAEIHPGAYDFCGDYSDGVDDDCDGTADNPDATYEFHEDADGDGYGAEDVLETGCEPPAGATTDDSDCDDTVADANPEGTERYAWGIDYDCDGDLIPPATTPSPSCSAKAPTTRRATPSSEAVTTTATGSSTSPWPPGAKTAEAAARAPST